VIRVQFNYFSDAEKLAPERRSAISPCLVRQIVKKQGAIALEKGLIVALRSSSKSERSGRTVQMTKRGRRGIEDILGSEESDIPRVFAHLLSKSGHVTEDPFYIYANAPFLESWKHKKNEEWSCGGRSGITCQ
jgi:hypothetical protein